MSFCASQENETTRGWINDDRIERFGCSAINKVWLKVLIFLDRRARMCEGMRVLSTRKHIVILILSA